MSADTGGSNRLPRPLGAGWIALGTVSRPNGDTWALGALPALGPDGSWHPAMLLSPVVESRFDMPRVLEAFQQWSAPARAGRKLRPAPDLDVLFRRVPGSAERAPHPVPGLPPQAVLDAAAEVPAEVAAAVGRGELSVLQVWKHHPGLFTQPEVGPLASTRPTLAPLATSDLDALDAAYSLALQATRRRSPFAGSPGRPPERHIAPGARALYDALAEELGPAPSRTEREMAQCFVAAVSRGDRLLPDLPDLLDLFKRLRREKLTPAHRVRAAEAAAWSLPRVGHAPRTLGLLAEVWDGCADRDDRIDYLLEWLGVALVGRSPEFKDSPLLIGPKDTGKSLILNTIAACFPAGSRRSSPLHALAEDYHRASLVGARLNVVTELPARRLADGEAAKAIISGDPVSARSPYGKVFTLRSRCAHIFAGNDLPPTLDSALLERFTVLGCRNVVPLDRQRRDLAADLATEAPHIVAIAIATVEQVLDRGFIRRPPSSAAAAEAWASASDPVRRWARAHLEPHEAGRERSKDLYSAFCQWVVREERGRPPSVVKWSERMEGLGFEKLRSHGMRWRVRPLRATASASAR